MSPAHDAGPRGSLFGAARFRHAPRHRKRPAHVRCAPMPPPPAAFGGVAALAGRGRFAPPGPETPASRSRARAFQLSHDNSGRFRSNCVTGGSFCPSTSCRSLPLAGPVLSGFRPGRTLHPFPGRAFPDAGVSGAPLRGRATLPSFPAPDGAGAISALRAGIPRAVLAARSGANRLASPRSRCRWQCPITDAGDRVEPDRAFSDPAAGMPSAMNTHKTPGAIRLRRGRGL